MTPVFSCLDPYPAFSQHLRKTLPNIEIIFDYKHVAATIGTINSPAGLIQLES